MYRYFSNVEIVYCFSNICTVCKYILDFNIRDTCISIIECSEKERRKIPVEKKRKERKVHFKLYFKAKSFIRWPNIYRMLP
jgi:hypothetical protein